MSDIKYLNNIDLNKNELKNAALQKELEAPLNPVKGQVYFDTVENKPYVYDGSAWKNMLDSDTGVTTLSGHTEESGKAFISASISGRTLTFVKGTFLTQHQDISGKLDKNTAIAGATKCKITYDSKGLVTGGEDLSASDIPTLTLSKISDAGTSASKNTGTSAGNVPVLDANGKLDTAILPALAITDTFVVNSQASMLALSAEVGDVAVRTDLNKSFILKEDGVSTLSHWQELLTPTDAVSSVNGKTGAVTLTASDVGALSEHQSIKKLNTTATTAQSTNASEDIAGSGTITLHKVSKTGSFNDLLDKPSIPTDTNQKIKVGSTTFGDDDAVEIVAGTNVTVTPNATNKTITISASTGKYVETNSASTASTLQGGIFTWVVNHNLGTEDVHVMVNEVTSKKVVVPEIEITDSNNITIEILSASAVSAGTYKVTVIG